MPLAQARARGSGWFGGGGGDLQKLLGGQGAAGALAEVVEKSNTAPLQRRRGATAGDDCHPAADAGPMKMKTLRLHTGDRLNVYFDCLI